MCEARHGSDKACRMSAGHADDACAGLRQAGSTCTARACEAWRSYHAGWVEDAGHCAGLLRVACAGARRAVRVTWHGRQCGAQIIFIF